MPANASVRSAGLIAVRAEIATSGAMLGGWALVTYAIAQLLASRVSPTPVWALSGGLLLLSLAGWKLLFRVAREGLYALTRDGHG